MKISALSREEIPLPGMTNAAGFGALVPPPALARNVVICFDGTNFQYRASGNTNVARLREVLAGDAAAQLVYYDPGVGTLPEPGWLTSIGQTLSRWWSLAFGTGLIRNVEEAYCYLMNYWEPGDRVFLFGFSRGAYSARVLVGLLHSLGLLPQGSENLVPYLTRLYGGTRSSGSYWRLCNKFRRTFARPIGGTQTRRFPIHFLGVWDTVSSVGWVWDPKTYPYTAGNPSVATVRHAVSIGERRAFFRQNLFKPVIRGQNLKEHWFPGAHTDVGGGDLEAHGGIWQSALDWMITEARQAGLHIDEARLRELRTKAAAGGPAWAEPQHESLRGAWWLAELVPKFRRSEGRVSRCPRSNFGRHREIHDGALIDRSALLRIRDHGQNYCPPNLSQTFLDQVRSLAQVPDDMSALPYRRQKTTA
jgi:uncharacterized protein (DUF2235 family)